MRGRTNLEHTTVLIFREELVLIRFIGAVDLLFLNCHGHGELRAASRGCLTCRSGKPGRRSEQVGGTCCWERSKAVARR